MQTGQDSSISLKHTNSSEELVVHNIKVNNLKGLAEINTEDWD